mmetsp:Transcript_19178/g.44672  ORF Transcript_19178/g.44672 Transcript_19178/m.44672 type:complete len:336 (+) Transcript_19178:80-1087(+)
MDGGAPALGDHPGDGDWWTPETALLWTGVVTIGIQGSCFLVAASCKFDKITDFAGSMNFVAIALMSLFIGGHYSARNLLLVAYVCVSRFELALFLLMRVLKRGKDDRFDEVREHFCRFLAFWVFQALWAWTVTSPVVLSCAANADADLEAADYVGLALFVNGLLVQFVADYQKSKFRADAANRGRICDVGIWKWSRHPNYWGEILMWWGVFVGTLASGMGSDTWLGLMSPGFTMLILLGGTGMPVAENESIKRYGQGHGAQAFWEYRNQTSPLITVPPALYLALPHPLRVLCCCEFGCYGSKPESSENPLAGGTQQTYSATDSTEAKPDPEAGRA